MTTNADPIKLTRGLTLRDRKAIRRNLTRQRIAIIATLATDPPIGYALATMRADLSRIEVCIAGL